MKFKWNIPARTETLVATWCMKEWMPMSSTYRNIRGKSRNPMCSCFWCGHYFVNGEMMALAQFEKKGNKTLCQKCADALISSENPQ